MVESHRAGSDVVCSVSVAGLMVGLVALPLALGFGASSGLGTEAGQVTVIVAGAVAAVLGGSRVQVSGPTGTMTVVLAPIVATGAPVLADTIARLESHGITALLSGLHPRHDRMLREPSVHDRLGHDRHPFATTPEAIAHARRHTAREHHEAHHA